MTEFDSTISRFGRNSTNRTGLTPFDFDTEEEEEEKVVDTTEQVQETQPVVTEVAKEEEEDLLTRIGRKYGFLREEEEQVPEQPTAVAEPVEQPEEEKADTTSSIIDVIDKGVGFAKELIAPSPETTEKVSETIGKGIELGALAVQDPKEAIEAVVEEDIQRGFKQSVAQIPQLTYGALALVGKTSEDLIGYGEGLKDWGLKGYLETAQAMEPLQKDTDDVTVAWNKFKEEGDIGALIDWAQYGIGYGLGQISETAAISALGGMAGVAIGAPSGPGAAATGVGGAALALSSKQAAKKLINNAVRELAEKEIKKQAKKQGIELTAKEVAEAATKEGIRKQVAKELGSNVALLANATKSQLGSIYGEAEQKAKEEGRELTGVDLARVWGTGLVTGGIESFADKFGLDLITAKKGILPTGRISSAITGGAKGLAIEGGTEVVQSIGERFGAGKEITGEEATKEYINAFALGGLIGGSAGTIGGVVGGGKAKPSEVERKTVLDKIGEAEIEALKEKTNALDTTLGTTDTTIPKTSVERVESKIDEFDKKNIPNQALKVVQKQAEESNTAPAVAVKTADTILEEKKDELDKKDITPATIDNVTLGKLEKVNNNTASKEEIKELKDNGLIYEVEGQIVITDSARLGMGKSAPELSERGRLEQIRDRFNVTNEELNNSTDQELVDALNRGRKTLPNLTEENANRVQNSLNRISKEIERRANAEVISDAGNRQNIDNRLLSTLETDESRNDYTANKITEELQKGQSIDIVSPKNKTVNKVVGYDKNDSSFIVRDDKTGAEGKVSLNSVMKGDSRIEIFDPKVSRSRTKEEILPTVRQKITPLPEPKKTRERQRQIAQTILERGGVEAGEIESLIKAQTLEDANAENPFEFLAKLSKQGGVKGRVADLLMKLGGLNNIKVNIVKQGRTPWAGKYNKETKEITINLDARDSYLNEDGTHDVESTLLHELGHAAFFDKLNNQETLNPAEAKAIKELEGVYDKFVEKYKDAGLQGNAANALNNINEFVSEVLVNPVVQVLVEDMTPNKSLLQKVLQYVLNFIQGKDVNPYNELSQAWNALNTLTNRPLPKAQPTGEVRPTERAELLSPSTIKQAVDELDFVLSQENIPAIESGILQNLVNSQSYAVKEIYNNAINRAFLDPLTNKDLIVDFFKEAFGINMQFETDAIKPSVWVNTLKQKEFNPTNLLRFTGDNAKQNAMIYGLVRGIVLKQNAEAGYEINPNGRKVGARYNFGDVDPTLATRRISDKITEIMVTYGIKDGDQDFAVYPTPNGIDIVRIGNMLFKGDKKKDEAITKGVFEEINNLNNKLTNVSNVVDSFKGEAEYYVNDWKTNKNGEEFYKDLDKLIRNHPEYKLGRTGRRIARDIRGIYEKRRRVGQKQPIRSIRPSDILREGLANRLTEKVTTINAGFAAAGYGNIGADYIVIPLNIDKKSIVEYDKKGNIKKNKAGAIAKREQGAYLKIYLNAVDMPNIDELTSISKEKVAVIEADRQDVNGDTSGGPLAPWFKGWTKVTAVYTDENGNEIEVEPRWASVGFSAVTGLSDKIAKETDNGIALVSVGAPLQHRSNAKNFQLMLDTINKLNLPTDQLQALKVIIGYKGIKIKYTEKLTREEKEIYDNEIEEYEKSAKFARNKNPNILKANATNVLQALDAEFELSKLDNEYKERPWYTQVRNQLNELFEKDDYLNELVDAGLDNKKINEVNQKYAEKQWYKDAVESYDNRGASLDYAFAKGTFKARQKIFDKLVRLDFIGGRLLEQLNNNQDMVNVPNNAIVAAIQLSKDQNAFAIWNGKTDIVPVRNGKFQYPKSWTAEDKKNYERMTPTERGIREQFIKQGFVPNVSYPWTILGPKKGKKFLLKTPVGIKNAVSVRKKRDIDLSEREFQYRNQLIRSQKLDLVVKNKIKPATIQGPKVTAKTKKPIPKELYSPSLVDTKTKNSFGKEVSDFVIINRFPQTLGQERADKLRLQSDKALNKILSDSRELERRRIQNNKKITEPRRKPPGKAGLLKLIAQRTQDGKIPTDQADTIISFVNSLNEDVVKDLRMRIIKYPGSGAEGSYDLDDLLLTVYYGNDNEAHSTIHEFFHHLTKYMSDEEINTVNNDYYKNLKKYVDKNPWFAPLIGRRYLTESQYQAYELAFPEEAEDKFIRNGDVYKIAYNKENYKFLNLDEWIAETMTDYVLDIQETPNTILGKIAKEVKRLLNFIKEKLGNQPYQKLYNLITDLNKAEIRNREPFTGYTFERVDYYGKTLPLNLRNPYGLPWATETDSKGNTLIEFFAEPDEIATVTEKDKGILFSDITKETAEDLYSPAEWISRVWTGAPRNAFSRKLPSIGLRWFYDGKLTKPIATIVEKGRYKMNLVNFKLNNIGNRLKTAAERDGVAYSDVADAAAKAFMRSPDGPTLEQLENAKTDAERATTRRFKTYLKSELTTKDFNELDRILKSEKIPVVEALKQVVDDSTYKRYMGERNNILKRARTAADLKVNKKNEERAKKELKEALDKLPKNTQNLVLDLRNEIEEISSNAVKEGLIPPNSKVVIDGKKIDLRIEELYYINYDKTYLEQLKMDESLMNELAKFVMDTFISNEAYKIMKETNEPITKKEAREIAAGRITKDEAQTILNNFLETASRQEAKEGPGVAFEKLSEALNMTEEQKLAGIPKILKDALKPLNNLETSYIQMTYNLAQDNIYNDMFEEMKNLGLAEGWVYDPKEWDQRKEEPKGFVFVDSRVPEFGRVFRGLKVAPEFAQGIESRFKPYGDIGSITKLLSKFNVGGQLAVTVFDYPRGVLRQFLSGPFFMLNTGYFGIDNFDKARKVSKAMLKLGSNDPEINQILEDAIRLGIVGNDVTLGRIRDLLKQGMVNSQEIDAITEIKDVNKIKKIPVWLSKRYQRPDDHWRLLVWFNEIELLKEAYPDYTRDQIITEAADRTLKMMPAYSRMKAIGIAARKPGIQAWIGAFVGFGMEMVRVVEDTAKLTKQDIMSGNPVLRNQGFKRLAGIVAAHTATLGLEALSKAIYGIGDDEEEAARDTMFMKNDIVFWFRKKDGALGYVSLGWVNPFTFLSVQPFRAIYDAWDANKPTVANMANSVYTYFLEAFGGYFTFNMFTEKLSEAIANEEEKIYPDRWIQEAKEGDLASAAKVVYNVFTHAAKTLIPAGVFRAENIYYAATDQPVKGQVPELLPSIGDLFLAKTREIRPEQSFRIKAGELNDTIASISKEFKRKVLDKGRITEEEIRSAYESADVDYKKYLEKMSQSYRYGLVNGLTIDKLDDLLSVRGLSKDRINQIKTNQIKPYQLAPASEKVLEKDFPDRFTIYRNLVNEKIQAQAQEQEE